MPRFWKINAKWFLISAAAPAIAWGQLGLSQTTAPNPNAGSCQIHQAKGLPGSHFFGSDFIEALATDSASRSKDLNVVWGLTVDLSDELPGQNRAIYISKTTDGGETWTQVARVGSQYFDAEIGEGLRNGLSVSHEGAEFVITTQRGAFQVFARANDAESRVRHIAGPVVPHPLPWLSFPKVEGDPIKADTVQITADGRHMIVGYGYFDLNPQIFIYHRDRAGSWVEDGPLPHLPTDMDILSMQLESQSKSVLSSLYVGTGDQAYRLDMRTRKWTRLTGVGPDSAIHGMSVIGGPHLAACWGVYNPLNRDAVKRVTEASFLLHPNLDEVGPDIRAYGIDVDPLRPNRQAMTAITGVYVSSDNGKSWRRLNDLPDGEFRSAHFNADGSVIVSGLPGTFVANPFSMACTPHLKTRDRSGATPSE